MIWIFICVVPILLVVFSLAAHSSYISRMEGE